MKLSKPMYYLLRAAVHSVKVGNDKAYIEVGRYKPFSTNSVKALVNRGLIKVVGKMEGAYYVVPLPSSEA